MRYFLRSRVPDATRVLVVESGSRWVMEKAVGRMRTIFPQARFDLCTCFPQPPPGEFDNVFQVTAARGAREKLALVRAMRRTRPALAAVLFTGEPILFPWKILLLAALPSKVLVVNENGDFFWLDWSNRATVRRFLSTRSGVGGVEIFRFTYRLMFLPLALSFLAVYTALAYAGRWLRLLAARAYKPLLTL